MDAAHHMAQQMVQAAPLALAAVKEVLRATQGQPVHEAYRTLRGGGLPTYRAMLTSNDAKEGPIAFGEKRPPRWSGT